MTVLNFLILIFLNFFACRSVSENSIESDTTEIINEIQIDSMPRHVFGDDDLVVHYLIADSENSERVILDFGVDIFRSSPLSLRNFRNDAKL